MTDMWTSESDLVDEVLQEVAAFRDPEVKAMFEVYVDRGWVKNLFSRNERWIEVQWVDDGHLRISILSRPPLSEVPANWRRESDTNWSVSTSEMETLSDWITKEWIQIRQSHDMRLRMWTD